MWIPAALIARAIESFKTRGMSPEQRAKYEKLQRDQAWGWLFGFVLIMVGICYACSVINHDAEERASRPVPDPWVGKSFEMPQPERRPEAFPNCWTFPSDVDGRCPVDIADQRNVLMSSWDHNLPACSFKSDQQAPMYSFCTEISRNVAYCNIGELRSYYEHVMCSELFAKITKSQFTALTAECNKGNASSLNSKACVPNKWFLPPHKDRDND
jgi:hypothetical protein